MILVDISSILHRMIFGSTRAPNLEKENNKLITEGFIAYTLHLIISEIIQIQTTYHGKGEIVLCFDDYTKSYWRRDVFNDYKRSRRVKSAKDESPINYKEVYEYTNELFEQFQKNTPWKCVYVNRAEADDIILILAKEYYQEGILIHSPDKDFLQSQRLPNITQYSALTKKWLKPENKNDDMKHWITEHIILGDDSDGVPKITDHTEFSESFINHIETHDNHKEMELPKNVKEFKSLSTDTKNLVLATFDVKTYNKRGEETGYDIYDNKKFGAGRIDKIKNGYFKKKEKIDLYKIKLKELRDLKKTITGKTPEDKEQKIKINATIKEIKNLSENVIVKETPDELIEEFLDSHPLYREHYNRNFILVMEEGIPDYIRANILMEFKNADTTYNEDLFNEYLDSKNLGTIKSKLPLVFKSTQKLDVTNHGWDF